MTAKITHFPLIRAGEHVILHEQPYSRIGEIEVMVGRVVSDDTIRFAFYLRAPGVENRLVATVTSRDFDGLGDTIDGVWKAIEGTLAFARERSGDLLAEVPQPWGAA